MIGMPPADFEVNETIIRQLLKEQISEFRPLELKPLGLGWDNVMYKLGDDKIIRLPRTKVSDELIQIETKWLNHLASHLPITIPTTLFAGKPNAEYPFHWSVLPYFEGLTVNNSKLDEREVLKLAEFLKALHMLPISNTIGSDPNSILQVKADSETQRIERVKNNTEFLPERLTTMLEDGLSAIVPKDLKWIHADIHARNVIVNDNKIEAIIDWGDMTNGDVSRDLCSFWTLFSNHNLIMKAFEIYGATKSEITRSKAWAILFGIIMLDSGLVDNPEHEKIGKDILTKMNLLI